MLWKAPHREVVCALTICIAALGAMGQTYNIAVLPDTQIYAESYPEKFDAQTQWIADNAEARNIVFTTHLGDIVQYGSREHEWDRADHSLGILDAAGGAYSVVPGNHDLYGDGGVNYLKYVPASRFASMPTYGGHSSSGMSQYHIAKMGDQDILMLSLDIDPPDAEIAWAQSVLSAHADTPTILSTHLLMDPHGNIRDTTYVRHDNGNPAQAIWDELVMPNQQVFMTLNGHYHGTRNEVAYNSAGLDVHRILVDYQGFAGGGEAYLRMMEFDFEQNVIRNTSYSPLLGSHLTDETNAFVIEMDFARRFAGVVEVLPEGTILGGNIYEYSSNESRKGFRSVEQLVSGAGILAYAGQSEVTLDAVHEAGTYDSAADGMWTSYFGEPIDQQYIVFDLGRLLNIEKVAVWQFGEAYQTFDFSDQGAKEIRILVTDVINPEAGDFAEIGTIQLDQYVQGTDLEAQLFDLVGAEEIRYVKFEFLSNWGNAGYVGLSEVRFVTGAPIPEPMTLFLLAAGGAAIARRRHRRSA